MEYRRTQIGWEIITISLSIVVIMFVVLRPSPTDDVILVPAIGLIICTILFWKLTVIVNNEKIKLVFGIGLVRKSFPLDEIISCSTVRNRWWYGWGIHGGRGKWLYNISGMEAVELRMSDDRIVRIGTDEPQRLCEVIAGKLERS